MATRTVEFTCAWCKEPNQRTVETHYWALSQGLPPDTPEPRRFVLACHHCWEHTSVDLQSGESCRIGERLKTLREKAGLTQRQLAEKAGFLRGSTTVIAWAERGRAKGGPAKGGKKVLILGTESTNKLANALGVDPEMFADAADYTVHYTGKWEEGGRTFLHKRLIDLWKRNGLPAESPRISHPRLMGLQKNGKIQRLIRRAPVPHKKGKYVEEDLAFYDPQKIAENTIHFHGAPSPWPIRSDGRWKEGKDIYEVPHTEGSDIDELPDEERIECVSLAWINKQFEAAEQKPPCRLSWDNWREDCAQLGEPLIGWYVVDKDKPNETPTLVIVRNLAEKIVKRFTDPLERIAAPGANGVFDETGLVFNHNDWGEGLTEEVTAKLFNVPVNFITYCRTNAHPALDPAVNDGKARAELTVPAALDPNDGGRKRKWFPCRKDIGAIVAWEKRLIEKGEIIELPLAAKSDDQPPIDAEEILRRLPELPGKHAKQHLEVVLQHLGTILAWFAEERPEACGRKFTWTKRKRAPYREPDQTKSKKRGERRGRFAKGRKETLRLWYETRLYLYDRFQAWLKDRGIAKLAKQYFEWVSASHLAKSVELLLFVLTQTKDDATQKKAADADVGQRFAQFRMNLRTDDTLKPLPRGVPKAKLKGMAKAEGIGWVSVLKAKRWLKRHGAKIKCRQVGGWQLAGPVSVPTLPAGAQHEQGANGQLPPVTDPENRPGLQPTEIVQVVCHICLRTSSRNEDKRPVQARKVQDLLQLNGISKKRIKDGKMMLVYAKRHTPTICPVCTGEKELKTL